MTLMNETALQKILNTYKIPTYQYFKETDSTNTRAMEWVSQGAPEYALVLADAQTSGRGRNQRTWITTPGASIAASIILHPTKQEQKKLGLFSLLGGYALSTVLETQYKIPAQVKWPNDVLIENKKTAGILAETIWQGAELAGLVLGIGINVFKSSIPQIGNLLFPATCIEAHCELSIIPEELLGHLLQSINAMRESLLSATFIRDYESKLAYKGETVTLDIGDETLITGMLRGIDEEGNIILSDSSGIDRHFPIGDIKLRPK